MVASLYAHELSRLCDHVILELHVAAFPDQASFARCAGTPDCWTCGFPPANVPPMLLLRVISSQSACLPGPPTHLLPCCGAVMFTAWAYGAFLSTPARHVRKRVWACRASISHRERPKQFAVDADASWRKSAAACGLVEATMGSGTTETSCRTLPPLQ